MWLKLKISAVSSSVVLIKKSIVYVYLTTVLKLKRKDIEQVWVIPLWTNLYSTWVKNNSVKFKIVVV